MGKFDVTMLRYLSGEEFRVLVAVKLSIFLLLNDEKNVVNY